MAIGRLALHRDEQVAARHFSAVERHARNGEGRRSDAPRGLSNLFGGPEVSHSPPSIRFERSREPLRITASTLAGSRKARRERLAGNCIIRRIPAPPSRSEEPTPELQSLMRI